PGRVASRSASGRPRLHESAEVGNEAMTPLVKICGVRRVSDAVFATSMGATHIGCVLAADSPRRAKLSETRAIALDLHGFAQVVLVTRRLSLEETIAACETCGVRNVQPHMTDEAFHSSLEARGLTVYRVHRVGPDAAALPVLEPPPGERRPA